MTLKERQLFNDVLAQFKENYPEISVDYPYGDDYYMEFTNTRTEEYLGSLNISGVNFAFCIYKLASIY